MKPRLCIFLTLVLFCSGPLFADGDTSDSELLGMSRYWPVKVRVHKEVTGKMHGNIVSAGREWVFLRYENGKCLVDMGHNGIFRLDPGDTDIIDRMRLNLTERPTDYQGLFTHRYTKSFFDPTTLKGYQFGGDLEECEYFLVVFFDYESRSDVVSILGDFVAECAKPLKDEKKLGTLLVPRDNIIAGEVVEEYLEDGLNAPTIAPYKREGFIHSLHHDPEKEGDVLVVDKNGMFLGRFFLSDLGEAYDHVALQKTVEKILQNAEPAR